MDFEWDVVKSERNRLRRELPFESAAELFDGHIVKTVDDRHDYQEIRFQAVGVAGGLVLVCIYTDRGNVRRIISLRRANRRERDAYGAKVPG
jgi:uncharacterized DUF497 family protein